MLLLITAIKVKLSHETPITFKNVFTNLHIFCFTKSFCCYIPICKKLQVCKEALKLEQKEDVKFMRQGKTGGWKNQFSEETIKAFEEWEKQRLEDQEASKGGESLQFTYQL